MSQRIDRSMRVPPSPLIGIVIWALYVIYAVVSVLPSGIDFDELADTPSNVIKGIVIPVGLGAAALLAGVYFIGWWRPVFHEERRSPRWTLLIAAFLGLAVVVATYLAATGSGPKKHRGLGPGARRLSALGNFE
jgi:drug/metabolite transporter (DMT)-like permease